MNLRDHVDTAFQLAWRAIPGMSHAAIDDAWTFQHWSLCQAIHRSLLADARHSESSPLRLSQIIEEVLSWELLTRVTAAQLTCLRPTPENGQTARYASAIVLRCVTTREQLLADFDERAASDSELLRIDRLRRRYQRWTDLLICPLAETPLALRLAPFPDRCRQFAEECAFGRLTLGCPATRNLQASAIRRIVPNRELDHQQRVRLYREVLGRCLDLVPAESFQPNGMFKTRRQLLLDANLHGGGLLNSEPKALNGRPKAGRR